MQAMGLDHSAVSCPFAFWLLTASPGIAGPFLTHGLLRVTFSSGTLLLGLSLIV